MVEYHSNIRFRKGRPVRVDIEMPTWSKADLAKRLFGHVESKTTDLASGVLEIDSWQYRDPELARRETPRDLRPIPGRGRALHRSTPAVRFHRIQLADIELLLVRQQDESVRAFVNVCRHRGARRVEDESGSRKQFSCRYHRWG